MDAAIANGLLDGYAKWWRESFNVVQDGEAVRIITPMLDRHNDHMSIYLSDDPETDGGYIMTDLGATISDLTFCGCEVVGSNKRESQLDSVLRGFGLSRHGNEIFTKSSADTVFNAMNFLMQGMSSVDDLFFTTRDFVRSLFKEDVEAWLDAKEIRYSPDIKIAGTSGFESHFDFVIPKTGKKAPERLLKTVSTPSKNSVENALFGCLDIRPVRPESKVYVFLNKQNARNGKIDSSLLVACKAHGAVPVVWDGNADEYEQVLAA